ncbi:MAG TPA: CBS domain-containing protein [Longimicrobiales bacterium]|nr:CBS domain-containing protein [Longimicrobiales bacterium]
MGQQVSSGRHGPHATRTFTRALLRDLRALEDMVEGGLLECGRRCIGAEQEMFLVDEGWRPAPVALELLRCLEGPYTTELALYNLEANIEPRALTGSCFSDLEARVRELVDGARRAAQAAGADVALVGILPTLLRSDVTIDNITPFERYHALNDALAALRGGEPHRLRIEGIDELYVEDDSVILESCNTSFQVHLQVGAREFAEVYNVAQLVTAPVMAAAVNSPILFGKHLWDETRIALFQQSVDARSSTLHVRELAPRVRFGEDWLESSVCELFQEDVARYRVLLTSEVSEDPVEVLRRGGTPGLEALRLHNGTVYRWNRPCYGVNDGVPHLRIECRVLPAGPTVVDEVANAAFWSGLVLGARAAYGDVRGRLDFADAKANFLAAARHGLQARFRWLDGETRSAQKMIVTDMIPLAREGLLGSGVDREDVDRYLGIVQARVESGTTGARWILRSLAGMKSHGTRSEQLAAVTSGAISRQKSERPCHMWDDATIDEAGGWRLNYTKVEQFMTTSLFTVHEDELVDMVAFLMDRKRIHHVLVEDDAHSLVGLVSYRSVLRLIAEGFDRSADDMPAVKSIMVRDPVSVAPDTPTLEAIDVMRHHGVSCLPVVSEGKLVGIVSESDFMSIAYELLESRRKAEGSPEREDGHGGCADAMR